MNENLDNEMKKFEEQIADDLDYTQKDENIRRRKSILNFNPRRKTLILGGAGILILIVLIALFSGGDNKLSTGDLTSIQVRVDQLENRLTRLEAIKVRIASLEKQEKRLPQSMADRSGKPLTQRLDKLTHRIDQLEKTMADRSGKPLTQRLDKLTHRIDQLEKTMASAPAKTEASYPIQKKPLPLDKGRYHVVRYGENLYRIARQYGITVNELCRLNNMTPGQVIHPGQKLLVAPKSNQ